jgi:hypothetical protein
VPAKRVTEHVQGLELRERRAGERGSNVVHQACVIKIFATAIGAAQAKT